MIPKYSYIEILSDKSFLENVYNNLNIITEYIITLEDGDIKISSRYLIINIIFWKILFNLNIPIERCYVFKEDLFSEVNVTGLLTIYYERVLSDENSLNLIAKFKEELWQFYNELYSFATINCLEYVASLDIIALISIVNNPKVKKLKEEEFNTSIGTEIVEYKLKEKSKELITIIKTDDTINTSIRDLVNLNLLNNNQLAPMFIAGGVRTDINDVVIRRPIKSCIMDGLADVMDFTMEHFSAKKSIYYNSVAIKDSQYFGRKQQLAALPIEKIYPGDCGSHLPLSFKITEQNVNNVIGKNIIYKGDLININRYNNKSFIDKTVLMKSPTTCRYRDGSCIACGSTLMYNFPSMLHLGMQCSSNLTSIVTQLILSNKHFGSTKSLMYTLVDEATEFFTNRANGVYWKKDIFDAMGTWRIGVSLKDIHGSLDDVQLMNHNSQIQEERFSHITGIAIQSTNRGDVLVPLISGRHIPFFTMEMLGYIKNIIKNIEITDTTIWIPMNDFPKDKPIFRAPVMNDSMLAFVKSVTGFVQEDISSFTNINICLEEFSKLIYSKVSVNLLGLEVLLKAYTITSSTNYQVPIVEDVENVRFQNNAKLIANRSISGELAFQSLLRYISSFSTYLYPKSPGIFDKYFGFV